MVDDDLIKKVFVNDQMKTKEDFLKHMKSPYILSVIALAEGHTQGFAWLSDIKPESATGHFCFFRSSWGTYTETLGHAILKYWFKETDGKKQFPFDVIIGMTPENNKHAVKFIKELGFIVIGTIPHLDYGVISYLERKDYG